MTGRVILVIIDGLTHAGACSGMGYLNHLVEAGRAARLLIKAELPTISRPLYEVLLTGTACYVNNIASNHPAGMSGQKSLFHLTGEKGLKNAAAAYHWISELYNRHPFDPVRDREQDDESRAIQHGRFYFDDSYPDSHLFSDGELLRIRQNPDFLLIHPMGVDNAGHLYGPDSGQYRQKILEADALLGRLVPGWIGEGYHVLITSDHGFSPDGRHGGTSPEERRVPFFGIGPSFIPGVYQEEVSQLAVAPLICNLLEISPPAAMASIQFPALGR